MIYVHLHSHTAMVVGGSATRQPPRRSPHVPVVSRREAISPPLVAEDARVARRDDASRDCVPLPLFPFLSFPFLSFPFLLPVLLPPATNGRADFFPPLSLSFFSLSRVSPFLRLASLSGVYGHSLSLALSLSLRSLFRLASPSGVLLSILSLSLSLARSLSVWSLPPPRLAERRDRARQPVAERVEVGPPPPQNGIELKGLLRMRSDATSTSSARHVSPIATCGGFLYISKIGTRPRSRP